MKWPTSTIMIAQAAVQAIAPSIISASRATDIPAFYAPWFFNRLRAGHLLWRNPFNQRPQYVSFARTRAIVFWSKNPAPLLPFLPLLAAKKIACCLHFTLNDYEAEGWEPGLPPLAQRIASFRHFSRLLGPEHIVWRFDPLLLAGALAHNPKACEELLAKVTGVGRQLAGYTKRLVFSFADIASYAGVKKRLQRNGLEWRNFTQEEMIWLARKMASMAASLGMKIGACAEEMDLGPWGVDRSRCVDPEMLLSATSCHPDILAMQKRNARCISLPGQRIRYSFPRDRGQRKNCMCLPSKDVGQYSTCPHGCIYCYAISSKKRALANFQRHDPGAASIVTCQARALAAPQARLAKTQSDSA
jgi:hypothetical protein